jgi:acyl-[acyl-carrier-protein]-phospholipid O-acyltransferase/long-chain-fatty-acid--[acyl-carrier-protein] ligase
VPAVVQVVDKVPLLGSGNTDYVAATALAHELGGTPEEREVA